MKTIHLFTFELRAVFFQTSIFQNRPYIYKYFEISSVPRKYNIENMEASSDIGVQRYASNATYTVIYLCKIE